MKATSRLSLALLAATLIVGATDAKALVFYDTSDPTHNTTAPTGTYDSAGWQYEGYFGSYLGTMISPTNFITAAHFGVNSNTFSYDKTFSGTTTVNYAIDTGFNGGLGYRDIAGTDLRIYQIMGGTFSTFASIYTGTADTSAAFVDIGRGGPRGSAVTVNGVTKGWVDGNSDGVARWGRNQFAGSLKSTAGSMLVAYFDPLAGKDEATFSSGDSGGGAFIKVKNSWQLVGINYGVEMGAWDTDSNHSNGNEVNASIFNRSGLYENTASGWSSTALSSTKGAAMYVSRISASASEIQSVVYNVTPVPEPSGVMLVGSALMLLVNRRSRGKSGVGRKA